MNRKSISSAILSLLGLLSTLVLLVNVEAQAPRKAQIAFVSDRDGNGEIYLMDTDGKNQRNLTNHPADDFASPHGLLMVEKSRLYRRGGGGVTIFT